MARSPTSSVAAPGVPEATSDVIRYASLRESRSKTRSWYGSWPRKSVASTHVAHETILGGTLKPNSLSKLSYYDTRKHGEESASTDSLRVAGLTLSRKSSNVTLADAKGKATSGHLQAPETGTEQKAANDTKQEASKVAAAASTSVECHDTDAMDTTPDRGAFAKDEAATPPPPVATTAGWFSWGGKGTAEEKSLAPPTPVPETPDIPKVEDTGRSTSDATAQGPPAATTIANPTSSGGMWQYLWSASSRAPQPQVAASEETLHPRDAGDLQAENVDTKDTPTTAIPVPTAQVTVDTNEVPVSTSTSGSGGSTWAFWSRDARNTTSKSPQSIAFAEPGEMAVMGELSEANPKPALADAKAGAGQESAKPSSIKDMPGKDATTEKGMRKDKAIKEAARNAASIAAAAAVAAASSKKHKRQRTTSAENTTDSSLPSTPPTEIQKQNSNKVDELQPEQAKQEQPSQQQTTLDTDPVNKGQQTPVKPLSSNLLLPTFRSTYCIKENPSFLRQITQLLLRTQQPPAKHVFLAKDLPRVTKAVAIGVHGLYPAAYLRPMIGQPTGTSIRFANHAADAVRRWADQNDCADCKIEKIALEGEGKIADRVENLWKLLLNWIDHIRSADVVVLACHSQGVPVGFMLLAKLIDLGIVTTARIGVCAMGPFPDYKSGLGILMGSAAELWDFANPESDVSKRYELAIKTALDYGVRVAFIGSIDDQVVPLELRNLGVSDHGLIRELSVPLAGSLYSGEGHSRLYDEPQVYDIDNIACEIKHGGLVSPNPYHLPWIMRGLLEEDFVKTELYAETAELVKQYDDWKPVTKPLKDVKYRLEAVRSRL
ncbi:hypothetical protein SEPCBS119000_005695 [Sporothrix epigloea]|uniref:YMC020W-like alpha/beta hydrolase domain-containing protein n=1 Tax=Sporothrix epigloea TaxID=1892477 RepID=A0ABP0DZ80_9PEZI